MSKQFHCDGAQTVGRNRPRNAEPVRRRLLALVTALSLIIGLGAVSMTPAAAEVGVDWTSQTATAANRWTSVAYGNGVFVAISSDGTDQVMTSFDGVTWTARSAAMVRPWTSVTFGNGLFVAVSTEGSNGQGANGYGTDQVMTSSDGVTWTQRLAGDWNTWAAVTFGNGMFVAVGNSAEAVTPVMTSPDGITWTPRSAELNPWSSVTYGAGVFVAVAYGGTSRVMTSYYGDVWTPQTASGAFGWLDVTYGNETFVAVSFDGKVMTSPDGAAWTARTAPSASVWYSVAYGNGLFLAVAANNFVMTSPDGITWTQPEAPRGAWGTVTAGRGLFVVISYEEAKVMITGTIAPPAVPSAPTLLVATPGDGSASIAYSVDTGGAPISKIQYRIGSGAWSDAVGTSSPITISGLTNFQLSSIKLRAVNSAGTSGASASVQVRPRIAGSSLTSVTATGTRRILASFAALTPVGGTVSHYRVYAYVKGTSTIARSCRSTAAARSCVVTGLGAGTEYDVAVRGFFTVTGSSTVRFTLNSTRQTVITNP